MASRQTDARPPADDPVAAHSPALLKLFDRYLRWFFARNFSAVRLAAGPPLDLPAGKPVVVYTNHPSWWDPALFIVMSRIMFADRVGYGPMDADALEKYRFFKRIGIFGIEPGTPRGAARFLVVGRHILSDPGAMLWVTAEGTFRDARSRPLRLQPGIAHLAAKIENLVLLPMAMEFPFWDERYPEALLRFGRPVDVASVGPMAVADWTRLFEARLAETMDDLAAAAISRDPARFATLIDGSAGVGGVYDLWRRLKAWIGGRAFSARHRQQRRPR